jgi:hypothetical protein
MVTAHKKIKSLPIHTKFSPNYRRLKPKSNQFIYTVGPLAPHLKKSKAKFKPLKLLQPKPFAGDFHGVAK